jgi:hypothetical protein
MKKMNRRLICSALLVLTATIGTATSGRAQILLEQLQSSNYNANTGVWTATVGSDASGTGNGGVAIPTLAAGATPNGSPAVAFNGSEELTFVTPVPTETSYTVLAAIMVPSFQAQTGRWNIGRILEILSRFLSLSKSGSAPAAVRLFRIRAGITLMSRRDLVGAHFGLMVRPTGHSPRRRILTRCR